MAADLDSCNDSFAEQGTPPCARMCSWMKPKSDRSQQTFSGSPAYHFPRASNPHWCHSSICVQDPGLPAFTQGKIACTMFSPISSLTLTAGQFASEH